MCSPRIIWTLYGRQAFENVIRYGGYTSLIRNWHSKLSILDQMLGHLLDQEEKDPFDDCGGFHLLLQKRMEIGVYSSEAAQDPARQNYGAHDT
jgi:hypothetical protein